MGTALAANYTALGGRRPNGGADFASQPQWSTRVIDDADGPEYYDDDLATHGRLRLRREPERIGLGARGGERRRQAGGARSLASQGDPRLETLPRVVILAGFFGTTNNGKKIIVDAMGNSATAGSVAVRCATSGPSKNDPCLGYDPGKGSSRPRTPTRPATSTAPGRPTPRTATASTRPP